MACSKHYSCRRCQCYFFILYGFMVVMFMYPAFLLKQEHGVKQFGQNEFLQPIIDQKVGREDMETLEMLMDKPDQEHNNSNVSTGDLNPHVSTGDLNLSESTGDLNPHVSTGDLNPNVSTGNLNPNMSTGDLNSNVSTGDLNSNVSTGDLNSNVSTGDFNPNMSIGDLNINVSTGDLNSSVGVNQSRLKDFNTDIESGPHLGLDTQPESVIKAISGQKVSNDTGPADILTEVLKSLYGGNYNNRDEQVSSRVPIMHPVPYAYRSDTGIGPFIDLIHEPHPEYLPNYRTPCWVEPLYETDGTFSGNSWWDERIKEHMVEIVAKLPELFARRKEDGKTWKIRCLPYFYVAGVTKCGTSDLFNNIRRHPLITSPIKEIHWWNKIRASPMQGGIIPISKYVDMMDLSAMKIENLTVSNGNGVDTFHPMILGEGSPSYFEINANWHLLPNHYGFNDPRADTARNIYHVTPMAKIILIFRNPVTRVYSQYWYRSTEQNSVEDFHSRVVENMRKIYECLKLHRELKCVDVFRSRMNLGRGLYVVFLENWFQIYPQSQIHTYRLEDYATNSSKILNDIFNFLGVGELSTSVIESWQESGVSNKHEPVPPMLEETRQLLIDFYAPYNRRLSELLHDERFLWK